MTQAGSDVRVARILIVDDDDAFRALLEATIRGFGYDVAGAESVAIAWGFIQQFQPDLIILDLDLGPGPNGMDLVTYLQRNDLNTPVIVLTAHRSPKLVGSKPSKAKTDRQYAYLVKADINDADVLGTVIGAALENVPLIPEIEPEVPTITTSQAEVLRLIAEGYSNTAIAEIRHCSLRSLERIISRLYHSLAIADDTEMNPRVTAARMYRESKVTVR